MRRKFRWDKKYLHWGVTAFCVIACAILFFMALTYIPVIGEALGKFFRILSPFIWGLVLTYLLAPLMKKLEKQVFLPLTRRMFKKNRKHSGEKLARALSVLVSEIVLLAILTLLVYLIIPELYNSIEKIVSNIVLNGDSYINTVSTWVDKRLADNPVIEEYVSNALKNFNDGLVDWLQTTVLPGMANIVSSVAGGLYVFLRGLYNLVVGIIVSVYILGNLEKVSAGFKRFMYCIFTVEAADKLFEGIRFTDRTFMGFISGKLLDSAIIGLICYIFCIITGMPSAMLVSVIIGVTNIIPFFGPLIGAVPSALIILLSPAPLKCLIFVIFIIILQQIDGNLIGPKILGNSTGISGFWVLFSIILGAGLFGFWGMLLGVPVFVVIYTLVNGLVARKLERSDLPVDTEDYLTIERIDPVTREVIKNPISEQREDAGSSNDQK